MGVSYSTTIGYGAKLSGEVWDDYKEAHDPDDELYGEEFIEFIKSPNNLLEIDTYGNFYGDSESVFEVLTVKSLTRRYYLYDGPSFAAFTGKFVPTDRELAQIIDVLAELGFPDDYPIGSFVASTVS